PKTKNRLVILFLCSASNLSQYKKPEATAMAIATAMNATRRMPLRPVSVTIEVKSIANPHPITPWRDPTKTHRTTETPGTHRSSHLTKPPVVPLNHRALATPSVAQTEIWGAS